MLNDVQNNVPINYNMIFPTQSPLPIITSIKDNGQRLCSGQPLQAYPGGSTTTLTLQHTLKLPQVNYNYREPVYQPQSVYSPPPPPYQPTQTERPYNQPPVYQPPVYQPPQSERPIYQPVYQPPQSERPINQPPVYQPPQPERPIYQPVQPTRQQPVRTTTTYRPPVTRPTAQTVRPPQRQTTTRPRESSIPSFDTNNVQCGLPALGGSLSFGAQSINRGEWPWIVAIFIKTKATGLDFICGGTLVSSKDDFILFQYFYSFIL